MVRPWGERSLYHPSSLTHNSLVHSIKESQEATEFSVSTRALGCRFDRSWLLHSSE